MEEPSCSVIISTEALIARDADAVVFLLSPEYYLLKSEPEAGEIEKHAAWQEKLDKARHRIEFICAKRRSGPEGERASILPRAAIHTPGRELPEKRSGRSGSRPSGSAGQPEAIL